MSRKFKPPDYEAMLNQTISLGEALPQNHLARFVVDVIAQLDLSPLYARYAAVGGEALAPEILLGLLFYGYATGLFSSRQIERATYESIPFRFVAGGLHPDHDTIAHFRKTFLAEIQDLFVQILLLAQAADVLKLGNTPALRRTQCGASVTDLGVSPSHSRPHVSNDNPFSEAQFKTMKYQPDYPERFGSLVDARTWAQTFFPWYNDEHHHSGLGYLTPAAMHYGAASRLFAERQQTLNLAYAAHPERFVKGPPLPPALPTAVWINPPTHRPTPALGRGHGQLAAGAAVVVGAVEPVGNSERSGELSTTPPPKLQKGVIRAYPDTSIRL